MNSKKKQLIIGSVIALAVTGASALAIQATPTGAEDVPPIVEQVNQHETRIDTLEGQQEATEATVEQHTQEITVIKQTAGTAPVTRSTTSPTPTGTTTPPAPTQPTPEPVVVPEPDPRTILAVIEGTQGSLRTCKYTLYGVQENSVLGVVIQPMSIPCYQVGEVLPLI